MFDYFRLAYLILVHLQFAISIVYYVLKIVVYLFTKYHVDPNKSKPIHSEIHI